MVIYSMIVVSLWRHLIHTVEALYQNTLIRTFTVSRAHAFRREICSPHRRHPGASEAPPQTISTLPIYQGHAL